MRSAMSFLLEPGLPGAIIEAAFSPGFSEDLSNWRLQIDAEGNLLQRIAVWQYIRGAIVQEKRREQRLIGRDGALRLLLMAEEIGFYGFQDSYEPSVTDLPTYRLRFCDGKSDKAVRAYGAGWLAREGNPDMRRFVELWQAVHEHAPFPD